MIEKSAEIDRMEDHFGSKRKNLRNVFFLFLIKRNDFNLNDLIKLKKYIRNIKLGRLN